MSEPPGPPPEGASAAEVERGSQRLKRVVRPFMTLAALVFVIWAARDLARRWHGGHVEIAWAYLFASGIPILASGLVLAFAWKVLLERMTGKPVPTAAAIALHVESQLARYVPGSVGIPVVRMTGAASLGAPARAVGSSILIEQGTFVAVGGVVGLGLLSALFPHSSGLTSAWGRFAPWLLGAFVLGTIALVVVDRRHVPSVVLSALGLSGTGPLVPSRLPALLVLYWLGWACHGVLLVIAVGGSLEVGLGASGLFVIAPIVGFLALAAPAGAGVREAVFSLALSPILGAPAAVVVAIASRAVTLSADVALWLATRRFRAGQP